MAYAVTCARVKKARAHQNNLSNTTSHQASHQTSHWFSHQTSYRTFHQTHLPLATSAAAAHCCSPDVRCPQSAAIALAVATSAVERPGEKEMEMVEGGAIRGEDIWHGGGRLTASLLVSSAINIDVPCQRQSRLSSRCHLTPSPPTAMTAEEAGSEVVKYTTVSNGNLSPPPTAENGFGSGTHLPPPPTAGSLSPLDHHCPLKLLLPPPHQGGYD
jgi:hypothetical protein